MEQPFIAVIVTNTGAAMCALDGYPVVAMIGNTVARNGAPTESSHRLAERVHHGIYERPDPGPHRVELAHGQYALFYVGTQIGAGAHLVVIHQIQVTVSSGTAHRTVTLSGRGLAADEEPGQPVSIGVTAFQSAV